MHSIIHLKTSLFAAISEIRVIGKRELIDIKNIHIK